MKKDLRYRMKAIQEFHLKKDKQKELDRMHANGVYYKDLYVIYKIMYDIRTSAEHAAVTMKRVLEEYKYNICHAFETVDIKIKK